MKYIFIDTAEPKWIDDLFIEKGYQVARARIKPSGDYAFGKKYMRYNDGSKNNITIEHGVIIERKKVDDFDASFVNGETRLWEQLQHMQESTNENVRCYYAITGDISKANGYANVTPKQRISAIGSAMARYPNVPITTFSSKNSQYESHHMFVDYIDKLYRSYQEEKFGVGRTIPFKKSEHKSFDEYVLSGISGVSRERATEILKHFEINYTIIPKDPQSISMPTSVKGIGTKTWFNIKKELKL